MSGNEHPVWEEELMPYVDGQLDSAQASNVEEHLRGCQQCAAAVADARGLSQQMASWEVENPSGKIEEQVLAEVRLHEKQQRRQQRWAWWASHRTSAYAVASAFAALALIAVVVVPNFRSREAMEFSAAVKTPTSAPVGQDNLFQFRKEEQGQQGGDPRDHFELEQDQNANAAAAPSGPMVIRTAHLTILTKEFDSARSRIQAIVQQSQGYLDQLTVRGETGSGKSFSATLRLPSDRLDSGLTELRKLGKVLEESQGSSDVTSHYVDLQARLKNSRNTEQRLLTLQRERTDKLPDVVNVEREIARVREEIERMEAQRKDVFNKTQFATIQVELSEEYRAELQPSTPSAGTQLRNALIDGYHGALDSLMGLALFILRYGPALLLWSIVLVPVALVVRRRLQRLWA